MNDIRPVYPRTSRGQSHPARADQKPYNPFGVAIGFLCAGVWLVTCHLWIGLSGWINLVLMVLGVIAIFLGLLLVGTSIGAWLNRR